MDVVDPCGLFDLLGEYRKWVVGVLYTLGFLLLIVAGVEYSNDYAPYHKLADFQITQRWVSDPRPGCDYEGKKFDCYDGFVIGNYTWSGQPLYCKILVVTEFQRDETLALLVQQFPTLGPWNMWAANPTNTDPAAGQCVRSVNQHTDLWIAAGFFLSLAVLGTASIILSWCCLKARTHRRNVVRLSAPPKTSFWSSKPQRPATNV